jgi:hypothetical protein
MQFVGLKAFDKHAMSIRITESLQSFCRHADIKTITCPNLID